MDALVLHVCAEYKLQSTFFGKSCTATAIYPRHYQSCRSAWVKTIVTGVFARKVSLATELSAASCMCLDFEDTYSSELLPYLLQLTVIRHNKLYRSCRGASFAAVLRDSKEGKHYPNSRDISRAHCMASQSQVLQLYRDILKAAKKFPSIKRHQILADIKTEFHANKVRYQSAVNVWQCRYKYPVVTPHSCTCNKTYAMPGDARLRRNCQSKASCGQQSAAAA